MLIYTDGVFDRGEPAESERLRHKLTREWAMASDGASDLAALVAAARNRHPGWRFEDDVTLLEVVVPHSHPRVS